jgi:hypothetical protein
MESDPPPTVRRLKASARKPEGKPPARCEKVETGEHDIVFVELRRR